MEYGERGQETSCLLSVRGLQNYIKIEDLLLFSDHPTAFFGASRKMLRCPSNSSNNSHGSHHSLSAYYLPGTIPMFCIYCSHNSIAFNSMICLLWNRIQKKKIERKRFFLDHTSKEDYFLKFQKDGFDDVSLICSTLTLQRLFSLFFFIVSSQKVLSSRNHCPYFTSEKTEARGDCDQRHTHSWGTRPKAGTQVTSAPVLFPLLNPKLPRMRMGPENIVNAKPY